MNQSWISVLSVTYIFIFMFIAKFLKEKLGIFRSIIVPTSLLAGFLGLLLGDEVIGLITFDREMYADIVYHCLGIGFIALSLSGGDKKQGRDSVNSGLFILSNYCFQGVLGMLLVVILAAFFKPDLFLGLGLILPLAFGQGPGFAYSIGSTWDRTLGIGYAAQYGLTLATAGFLVGGLVGIILLNVVVRKQKIEVKRLKQLSGLQFKDLRLESVKEINFFDMLTTQVTWIAIIYFLALNTMFLLSTFLKTLGNVGVTVAGLVDGFNYLFGILFAIAFRQLLMYLKKRGHRTKELIDPYLMQSIASLAFHIMIAASVMAISIYAIRDYWEVLLVVSIGGTIGVLSFVVLFGRIAFNRHPWYYILAMFGMMTGTASTGLALLRGVDPELDTDVATNLVLGSAVAAPLGIPLMVLLSQPAISYSEGTTKHYYIAFFGILIYLVILMGVLVFRSRRERKRMEN